MPAINRLESRVYCKSLTNIDLRFITLLTPFQPTELCWPSHTPLFFGLCTGQLAGHRADLSVSSNSKHKIKITSIIFLSSFVYCLSFKTIKCFFPVSCFSPHFELTIKFTCIFIFIHDSQAFGLRILKLGFLPIENPEFMSTKGMPLFNGAGNQL